MDSKTATTISELKDKLVIMKSMGYNSLGRASYSFGWTIFDNMSDPIDLLNLPKLSSVLTAGDTSKGLTGIQLIFDDGQNEKVKSP